MLMKKKRPFIVAVQLDEREKRELKQAADQVGLPLSVFVRALALTAVRGEAKGGVRIEPAAA
jgi:hypothetical protein